MSDERERLQSGAHALGITVTDEQTSALINYCNLLEETNRSFNLTRIPRADYVTLHLLDSLTCLPLINSNTAQRIIDVGTGAGFPAVPLAALLPESQVVALDSTLKKVRWVEQTAHSVGINNLTGIHARAEALSQTSEHKEKYNVVVSRAVAPLEKLVGLVLPLLARGGVALACKGQGFETELEQAGSRIDEHDCTLEQVHEVALPGTEIRRYVLVMRRR
jgi:16S rRNA (guanine527-N7)-methyltransferase